MSLEIKKENLSLNMKVECFPSLGTMFISSLDGAIERSNVSSELKVDSWVR